MEEQTPKTPTDYATDRGAHCPCCGSTDITGDGVEVESGRATQEVYCNECDASWVDTYTLTGYVNLKRE
ncbi:hypothetical protein [Rhodanobacter denitrificans]|uniref:hypothetical protein n=1 Tax=Rhodanobacter denitrificans TaxID=666685 RepID=UPI001F26C559|nr:hypothetical protein [Rhodanobacter denitrificans]UJJ60606.1 hypothetical protein LRK55_19420 [Rhodanobacter denitrificans]